MKRISKKITQSLLTSLTMFVATALFALLLLRKEPVKIQALDPTVTTVAEALTLPAGTGSVYQVNEAQIKDGYNLSADDQILLVDTLDPEKTIYIQHPGINPLHSYRYIASGVISFTATIEENEGVNVFQNFNLISYTDDVEVFAAAILTGDTADQCVDKFPTFKTQVLAFETLELLKIQNGTDPHIVDARARYLAWAAALGEKPWEAGTVGHIVTDTEKNSNVNAIIIITIVGCSLVAVVYFHDRKYAI
ncbi:MAG: hypothetical protein ACOX3K_04730 [Bacilli bacterium]